MNRHVLHSQQVRVEEELRSPRSTRSEKPLTSVKSRYKARVVRDLCPLQTLIAGISKPMFGVIVVRALFLPIMFIKEKEGALQKHLRLQYKNKKNVPGPDV